MWRAGHEPWRVLGEKRFERLRHSVSEFVLLDSVPHVEHENASWPEDSPCLRKRLRLFGKEHDSYLAHHGVESSVFEWQLHCVCLTPFHRALGPALGSQIQHRLIQIR